MNAMCKICLQFGEGTGSQRYKNFKDWDNSDHAYMGPFSYVEQKLRAEKINTRWVGRPIGKASPSGGISYEDNLTYLQAIVKWKHYEYSLQAIVYSKCLVVFIEPKEVWSS